MGAIKIINLISRDPSQHLPSQKPVPLLGRLSQTVEGLRLLSEAARKLPHDKETLLPFINLGRNRTQFIPRRTYINQMTQGFIRPFFGLTQVDILLQSIQHADGRIEFLRRMAAKSEELQKHTCIIQYADQVDRDHKVFSFATVFGHSSDSSIQNQAPLAKKHNASHTRWIHPLMIDTVITKDTVYENTDYFLYAPSPAPHLTCTLNPERSDECVLQLWYGKPELAAIYIFRNQQLPHTNSPSITYGDLLWCLEYDLLTPEQCLLQAHDGVTETLRSLAVAHNDGFRTISEPVIQLDTLNKPWIDANCMSELLSNKQPSPHDPRSGSLRTISIFSYLVAGHDILPTKIPGNIIGISMGNSMFVPKQVLHNLPYLKVSLVLTGHQSCSAAR
ncbi:hypothetical protein FIE12Z_10625 [Fusarium flagelliforme]|uniref:Uncharacterized protein n=1 Tax=Fusarium flagelliforme TaxID=2675880 RepID=A0A395MB99_9HYPO|nr:hypothetical protein FIE12Z_10625 [Fusarium flagelliforme]